LEGKLKGLNGIWKKEEEKGIIQWSGSLGKGNQENALCDYSYRCGRNLNRVHIERRLDSFFGAGV